MSTTLAALSDPTRRAMLVRLMAGPASVHELAEPFRVTQQAISKHIATLERAQLIVKQRHGREQVCRLNPAPMQEVATWVEQYRQYWEDAFDQLDNLLQEQQRAKKRRGKS